MRALSILSVASEAFPLIKTGGLADVVGALPAALAKHDITMRLLLPLYPIVREKVRSAVVLHEYAEFYGGKARLLGARYGDLDLILIEAPHLYDRPGNPYTGPDGRD